MYNHDGRALAEINALSVSLDISGGRWLHIGRQAGRSFLLAPAVIHNGRVAGHQSGHDSPILK
jgi:hypothetical protein